ncbi:hypothetical protein ACRRTK_021248 [Alexandromys fortis]
MFLITAALSLLMLIRIDSCLRPRVTMTSKDAGVTAERPSATRLPARRRPGARPALREADPAARPRLAPRLRSGRTGRCQRRPSAGASAARHPGSRGADGSGSGGPAMETRYNLKSPAVKRLMKEAAELKDPTDHYHAQPLEDNLFEWHFTVRGPPDSDFDGGVYHGRIVLPPEYPMKPPSIILLTTIAVVSQMSVETYPRTATASVFILFIESSLTQALAPAVLGSVHKANGRFEVGKKICLSISGHHPETWQPSWSIRTALLAIIGFMPTKGEGAIGSLDYTPEERRALAKKSQDFCCEGCGSAMKDVLLPLKSGSDSSQADQEAKELARQISFKAEVNSSGKTIAESDLNHSFSLNGSQDDLPTTFQGATAGTSYGTQNPSGAPLPQPTQPAPKNTSMSPRQRRAQQQSQRRSTSPDVTQGQPPRANHTEHGGSAMLIVILTLALAALIFRRIYLANEYIFDFEL